MPRAGDMATRAAKLEHSAALHLVVEPAASDSNNRILAEGLEPVEEGLALLLLVLHLRLVVRLKPPDSVVVVPLQRIPCLARQSQQHLDYSVNNNKRLLQLSLARSVLLVARVLGLVLGQVVPDLVEALLVVAVSLEGTMPITSNNKTSLSEAELDLVLHLVRPQAPQLPSVELQLPRHPSEEVSNNNNNSNPVIYSEEDPRLDRARIKTKLNLRLVAPVHLELAITSNNSNSLGRVYSAAVTRTREAVCSAAPINSSSRIPEVRCLGIITNRPVTLVVGSSEINNKSRSLVAYLGVLLRTLEVALDLVSSKISKVVAGSLATRTSSNRSQTSSGILARVRSLERATTTLVRKALPLLAA